MKKIITSAAFFAALFFFTGNISAQNSAYWEAQANKLIAKTDRTLNYYNKQLNVFSPQEMQMMRNNDPRFVQVANKKTQRLDAAQRQYEAHYNKQWARSFNTFNTPRYVRDQYGNVYRTH